MVSRTALIALLLAAPAAAQETVRIPNAVALPGIGAGDPRVRVDRLQAPWRAIGRVQTEIGGRCTGAMIAPDRVLTAAHCLVSATTRRFVQPRSVHVLLGYERGEWAARGRVVSFVTGAWDVERGPVGADWAVLTLDARIGTPDRVLPLLRTAPAPRTPAMLGGYQQDRPEVLMADTGCRVIGLQSHAGGVRTLVHDCAGTRGASGAPLLARTPDGQGWGIAGVVSVTTPDLALGHAVPAGVVGVE